METSRVPRSRHFLWEIRPYFRQVAGQLVLGSIGGIIMNTAVVLPAFMLGYALDTAVAYANGTATAHAMRVAILWLVLGTLATEMPRWGKRWWLQTANGRIRANIRADTLRGVLTWPMGRLHQTPIGELMARIVGDVEVLGVGLREFTIETWDTLLFELSFIVAMAVVDLPLTGLALLPVPLAMWLAYASGRLVSRRTLVARQANATLTAALQEQLAGIRILRLFGRTEAAVDEVATLSQAQATAQLATIRLRTGLRPVYTSLMTAGVVLVLWGGAERVLSGALTVGAFVAYLELYLRCVGRGFRVPQLLNAIQSAGAAYERLRPLLATPLSAQGEPRGFSFRAGYLAGTQTPMPAPPAVTPGPIAVSVQDVGLRYPGSAEAVLRGVSFDAPAGAFVAITGPVGCGKTTLARAVLGLYPLEAGCVRLDGHDVMDLTPAERAERIGYAPQDGFLFGGSVRDNVLLRAVEPTSNAFLPQVLEHTALSDDIAGFPAGLETTIGERGQRVSGGQRQRLGLARALAASGCHTPGLLVLDDPFAAVDIATEARIIAALRQAYGPQAPRAQQATILMFSHRLAAFPQADLVLLMEDGGVTAQGTHATLMETNPWYARLYRAQRHVTEEVA